MFVFRFVSLVIALAFSGAVAVAEPFRIYIDADFSISPKPAEAIELGVRAALSEVDDTLGGLPVQIVRRDHRMNSKRSMLTFRKFLKDDGALVVIGGKQSPPYLSYRKYINDNGVLLLLPWSAAGPVTRAAEEGNNWVFRLSVDDFKAGPFLVDAALKSGCERIALVLVDTGWGRSNKKTMQKALTYRWQTAMPAVFFPPELGAAEAVNVAQRVAALQADCVILVATTRTGVELARAFTVLGAPPRVFSHWGILGDQFPKRVRHSQRAMLNLKVLQTCALQAEQIGSEALAQALVSAGGLESLSDIPAHTGFVHGYDLTKLLIAAADRAKDDPAWNGDIKQKRDALRRALETLQRPVRGVLAHYIAPFRYYSVADKDAHEALGADHLCLAVYSADGVLTHAR